MAVTRKSGQLHQLLLHFAKEEVRPEEDVLPGEAQHRADLRATGQVIETAEVTTLAGYTDWMKGIMTVFPDGRYELKAFAVDEARSSVVAYAVFHATHTGEGGPVPPTGRSMSTDYVYAMQFEGAKIVHMTKVWNSGLAMKAIGWG